MMGSFISILKNFCKFLNRGVAQSEFPWKDHSGCEWRTDLSRPDKEAGKPRGGSCRIKTRD